MGRTTKRVLAALVMCVAVIGVGIVVWDMFRSIAPIELFPEEGYTNNVNGGNGTTLTCSKDASSAHLIIGGTVDRNGTNGNSGM